MSQSTGVVFIKGAIPGETVAAKIIERKKDYSIAETVEIIDPSPDRIEPKCRVFNICGGCHYQHINYTRQIELKKEILKDCLNRIGHLEISTDINPLIGNQWGYRTKVQLKLSPEGQLGFYREGSRDIIPIDECPLATEPINIAITRISNIAPLIKKVKEISILSGKNLIALLKGDKITESTLEQFINIGFDGVSTDNGSLKGAEFCTFEGSTGYKYTVSPNGFYQTNWELNQRLIERVLGEADQAKNIIDVYGGAGNFAIPLSKFASKVLIVEENPHSKADAQRNIKINKLKNIKYISKSFEKTKMPDHYDLMILDPPRRGLTTAAVNAVKKIAPNKIIYISCNPATFARDILKLSDVYKMKSVDLVDMFPNTYHCEVIGIMEKGIYKGSALDPQRV
ncbi:MAG: class I SAM-dependent RNA methyltransferase [Nitrospirae bacterium]|nr:class I SAM-dependent RNA methyltransferase [Nitrospirota bacterium]